MSIIKENEKLQLLDLIRERWAQINADFSQPGVNKHTRAQQWNEIWRECRASGHLWTTQKDAKWLSGTAWPKILDNFKRKQKRRRKAGNGGNTRLNDVDLAVIKIIGKEGIHRLHQQRQIEDQIQMTSAIKDLLPVLTKSLRKGDCGKIGVIGGSAEYTGAPFFAAITPMKIGADLAFVYTHPAAAPVIKTYSPELIVYPSNDFVNNRQSINKLDALVFGPGLGREEHTAQMLKQVIQFAKETPQICVVIDADGLFYIKDYFEQLAGCSSNLVITPNHREFARLFSHVFPAEEVDDDHLAEQTKQLANRLGVCVVRKGEQDFISDGKQVLACRDDTSMRRCGGQGDILSGAIALFAYWAKWKNVKVKTEKQQKVIIGGEQQQQQQVAYTSVHMMAGAMAASQLVRRASRETFMRIGRSMCAEDVLNTIPSVIHEIDHMAAVNPFIV